jgi:hypothetical protein
VPRNPRLALPKHLRELAHRELHYPKERDDPEARRIGERLESVGKRELYGHEIRI